MMAVLMTVTVISNYWVLTTVADDDVSIDNSDEWWQQYLLIMIWVLA